MRVVFIGTGEIGVPVIRWLAESDEHELVGVVTQPDKPVGREQRIQPTPIKAAIADVDVPVLQPERIKREEAVAAIRALAPEVIVVMAYGQILPRSVLEIPSIACLNLHASLLPKYRGAAPIQAAIAAGDQETGITVMYMDEGLDTGDMLLEARLPIAPGETGQSLHDRLGAIAPDALREAFRQLAAGTAPRIPQPNSEATYAPKLEREHGHIDWNRSALAIERKIRAYDPWPGTYTTVADQNGRGRKLKIYRAAIMAAEPGTPGKIVSVSENGIVIGCGEGALRLTDVQLEGKKRMSAAEFVRGQPWIASAQLASFSFPTANPSA
ncbi:MAG: methionyl-tRNA formyltransferase [Verrucomicrobiota bacterium]|nr:methionyl-tRNA formyltransferase [Verrucomicrobiota bacterium]